MEVLVILTTNGCHLLLEGCELVSQVLKFRLKDGLSGELPAKHLPHFVGLEIATLADVTNRH